MVDGRRRTATGGGDRRRTRLSGGAPLRPPAYRMSGARHSSTRATPLRPYVPATAAPRELTPLAVVLGIVLSLTFGMVNAYLGLKIGITVSASIPSAVLSMTVLRGVLRR